MKICVISSFPPSGGRLNEYGYHLARTLASDPVLSVTVLADQMDSPAAEPADMEVVRCWRFNSLATPWRLLQTIKEFDPDVVWFNLVFSTFGDRPLPAFLGLCVPLLTRLTGRYVHVTLHHLMESVNLEEAQIKHPAAYQLAGELATRILLLANGVSVLLPAHRRTLLDKYKVQNVQFRPHGIFAAIPEYPDFNKRNNPEQRILAFGKWGTYKRLEILLEAFSKVSKECPNARLVVAGGNHPLTPGYVESLAERYAGSPNIEFKGYVPEEQVPELFGTSSMLVLPYTSPGGPSGVAHQACQFGLPVVSADLPLFLEMAADEAMAIDFYKTGDANSLAEKLCALLQDPERQREMSETNCAAALRMTMPEVVRQYLRGFGRSRIIRTLRPSARFRTGWIEPFRVSRTAANEAAPTLAPSKAAAAHNGDVRYSVVIPAYNEARRIGPTIESILTCVQQQRWKAEIIVVNDGSTDGTVEQVMKYVNQNSIVRLVSNPVHAGKGYSIRHGVFEARGTFILLSDADLSVPITESLKLFRALERGADIAIGSRWLQPHLQIKPQPLHRRVGGRAFNKLVKTILGLQFSDTQCGFKAFRTRATDGIFSNQRVDGWGFDAEILFLAKKSGLKVTEVPIVSLHDEDSRLKMIHGLGMALEVLQVRAHELKGNYHTPLRGKAKAAELGRRDWDAEVA
jgi:glycosyltransferase involved in cell wall biosynthesis